MTPTTEFKAQSVGLFPKFFQAKLGNRDLKIASGTLALNNQNTKVPGFAAPSGNSSFVSSPTVTASTKFVASANGPAVPVIVSNSAERNEPVNFGAQNTISPNSANTNFVAAPAGSDTTKSLTGAPNVIVSPPVAAPAPVVARSATNFVSNPATVNTTPTVTANNQVAFNPPAVASPNSGDSTAFRTTTTPTEPAPITANEQPAPIFARIQPTLSTPQTFSAPLPEAPPPAPVLKAPVPQPPAPLVKLPDPQPVLPLVIPSVPENNTGDSQPAGGTSTSKGDTSGGTTSGDSTLQNNNEEEAPPPPPPPPTTNNTIPPGGAGGGDDGAAIGTYYAAAPLQATGVAAPAVFLTDDPHNPLVEVTRQHVPAAFGANNRIIGEHFKIRVRLVNSSGKLHSTDYTGRVVRFVDPLMYAPGGAYMDVAVGSGNEFYFEWTADPSFRDANGQTGWFFQLLPTGATASSEIKNCPANINCLENPPKLTFSSLGVFNMTDGPIRDALAFDSLTLGKTWISTLTDEPAQDSVVVPLTTDTITSTTLRATDKIFLFSDDDK